MKKVVDAVRRFEGEVLGVAVLWNRGRVSAVDLDVPALVSLIDDELPSWVPDECKQPGHPCGDEVPVNQDVGHGKKFLVEAARQ